MVRNVLLWMMFAVLSLPLMAASPNAAMLYAKGTTWLNGGVVPNSSAVFAGDLVQTKADSVANINASGTNVMILPDSLIKFEGGAVAVDRGGVTIKTVKGLQTRMDDVTVTPAANVMTEFDVSKANGKVMIMARKGDVSISDESGTVRLSQGQQTTRDMSANKKTRRRGGAAPAAGGGILDSPIMVAAGGAAIGALITWVALQDSKPVSPAVP